MGIDVQSDPAELGFDPAAMARIDPFLRRYVDDGRLPGWAVLVSRHGRIVHSSRYGLRDVEAGLPIEPDTVFRIYSMTKPITSVAAMMLYEEGAFDLNDPVSRFLPDFGRMRVYTGGTAAAPATVPAVEPIRIKHLLTHTSGLSYGFHRVSPVDELYRAAGFEWSGPSGLDLQASCELIAGLPLAFQPGAEWLYSMATDVLGRLIEVVSGRSFDTFLAERIFEPLGMKDTSFRVPDDRPDLQRRLAALYTPDPGAPGGPGRAVRLDTLGRVITDSTLPPSGGSGLASTMADYHRFTQALRGGGALDGVRLLGSRTLAFMTRNHLPAGADLATFGRPLFAETRYDGVGFGLGFSVLLDPVAYAAPGSIGEFAWGGAASTLFWVDPAEDITAIFMTQLLPSSAYPIRIQLRQLVYGALV